MAAAVKSASSKSLTAPRAVETLIRVIRGRKVMLDRDLAELYGVKPIALRQQVKRNLKRFPEDFMFQLTAEETSALLSQFVIPTPRRSFGGSMPYVFTQEGVAMLSSVLRSPRAIQMNIGIMRAFVRLRQLIGNNRNIAARIEKLEAGHERTVSVIEILVDDIDQLSHEVKEMKALPPASKRRIGFHPGAK